MAATISVTCPECDTEITLPAELAGKKIRCKNCEEVFVVKAAAPRAAPTKKPAKAKKEEPPLKVQADEEDEGGKYGMTDTELPPRCPHCASDLDSRDAVMCLNCGYNLMTREFVRTRRLIERTAGDWILWHLPTALCILTILLILGFDIYYVFFTEPADDNDPWLKWLVKTGPIKLWVVIMTLIGLFHAAKFAFKRLVYHPAPPEKERSGR